MQILTGTTIRNFKIIRERLGMGKSNCPIFDVQIDGSYIDDDLIVIAKKVVETVKRKVKAVAVFYWYKGQHVGGESAMAAVDFAPDGKWENRFNVKAGDYTSHKFEVVYNETE